MTTNSIELLDPDAGDVPIATAELQIRGVVVAGFAGRDAAAVQEHIDELAELDVAPPPSVPCFYRLSASRLVPTDRLQVTGQSTSGEAEAVLISQGGELYVAVGSDHTDRAVEAYDIRTSKQIVDKPISRQAWRYADVKDRWDDLILRCYAGSGPERRLYQEGSLANLLRPEDVFAKFDPETTSLPDGFAMFMGTVPVIGPIAPSGHFEVQLEDPKTGSRLICSYQVDVLP